MNSDFTEDNPPVIVNKPPLRFVAPYDYTFETHCKGRWLGRRLLDVLKAEFKAYNEEYYVQAIEQRRVTINNKETTVDYKFKDNDLLVHRTVRLEPPILDLDIRILEQNDQLLIVEKPPGMTIHSGGGFHFNTMLGILFHKHHKRGLYMLHRLDKCTSGIIFFGKTKQISTVFHQNNEKLMTRKMYYARVSGDFDSQAHHIVDKPIVCLNMKAGIYTAYQKQKHKDRPEYHIHPLKQSVTQFKKLWYDQDTDSSLLECYPRTGRTHQIRVHLQSTGHPILNDTCYGGRFIGNGILRLNYSEEVYKQFMKENLTVTQNKQKGQIVEDQKSTIKKKLKLENGDAKQSEVQPYQGQMLTEDEWDYTSRAMEICLHSYRYTFREKDYTASRPYWYQKSLTPKFKGQS